MRNGRRWLALDADFMLNPFTDRLKARFGAAGVVAFVGFLCACKRSTTPGTISYVTEVEALVLLGIEDIPLVDNYGQKWTLDELWRWTGQQKQTARTRNKERKTARGARTYVTATHWERWQKSLGRQANAERMADIRGAQRRDTFWTAPARDVHTSAHTKDTEKEKEIEIEKGAATQQNGTVKPGATKGLLAGRGEGA